MKALYPFAELAGRVLLAVIFIQSGLGKIGGIEGTQGYMEMMGVPGILIYPTILVEVIGGLFIIVGFQTRIAALLLAGFSLLSGFLFHFDPSNQMEMISFMKNVTIAGGFLVLLAHGAGKISIDARR
ncbi:DoxX family protein [Salinispirillum sp. LH 10-3-1]|uniref:DoxX family protein n=1 Tax=Salinispirillum sp. LH 10-3-1 TaxID=2952525 RepID=A0AB38YI74_9GAMM